MVLAGAAILVGVLIALLIREQYARTMAVLKAREPEIAAPFMLLLVFAALLAAYQRHAAVPEKRRTLDNTPA